MIEETMTQEERILAAINLEPYDRVPVAPHINAEFALRRKGRPTSDAYNPALVGEGLQTLIELFDEVGGWDGHTINANSVPTNPNMLRQLALGYGDCMKYPGQDSRISPETSPQYEECEVMSVDDYDEIINLGWDRFLEKNMEKFSRGMSGFTLDEAGWSLAAKVSIDTYVRDREMWHKRGIPIIAGVVLADPQMVLSLIRTLPQFTLDMYRRPDKVEAALDAMVDDIAQDALESMKAAGGPSPTGIPGIMMACERGSGQYYNLKLFERFVWPYIKKLVLTWAAEGYVTMLHFDTDWTLNLPYLLELPPKTCICELDSTTDIFKAKEILRDHMCIMGDVPPALSSHGTPEEMEAYCKRLIDVVGKDTGLILSTGCVVPPDTKFENFKIMIDTAKNYYPYG